MNPNAQFERDLEQWLQTEAGASAPAGFHAMVMARARTLRQRPGWTTTPPIRQLRRGRGMTLLAAAALLLGGGALAAGSGILRLPSVVPPVPAPSLAAIATASPDATTTPRPSASLSPSPAPLSLDMTWTQVPMDAQSPRLAWLGDRFVLADVESGAVRTSTDGRDWQDLQPGDAARGYVDLLRGSFASWRDSAVGWWNPQDRDGPEIAGEPPITGGDVVQIVRPPAAPTSTTPFKGRIESMGIGPMGIVAQVHSDLDWDDWVRRKLGARTNNEWVTHVKSVDFEDGILRIKMDNGPGLRVVWADEGLEPGDYQDRGFGWYSPDGEQWTAMAPNDHPTADGGSSLPTGTFGEVVGVSDGFIATGAHPDGTGIWHSSDGLTWRLLGGCDCGPLLPWRGGALATDGDGRLDVWTSGGSADLPMAAQAHGTVATGPLGLVSVSLDDQMTLVSRDGIDFETSPIPAQMADAINGRDGPTVAVGDQTVLVLGWTAVDEFTMTPSLWLGTFEP